MNKDKDLLYRRHFIRHPMHFPLMYTVLENRPLEKAKAHRSRTINISRGGLLFSARAPVSVDSLIKIQMPFQNKMFNVTARVVHCRKSRDTGLYNIGVYFHKYREAFKVRLIEQMYLISEYRDLRSLELGKEISLQNASQEWINRYSERFKRLYW